MQNLQEYVRNGFDGMLVFGDIHGDYASMKRAYDYAVSNSFFFMSLGDLVDRDRMPYESVKLMYDVIYEGRGGFTMGNHDEKFLRYSKGAKVSFSRDAKQTLEDVGPARHDEFMKMYTTVMETEGFSAYFHKFDDIVLVHAATHEEMWENTPKMGKSAKSRYMVGETNGDVFEDGYPVRLYNWMDNIPMGRTVIVGHDRVPIHNVAITEPMIVPTNQGGKVVFLDTGCGKGGFLSGAVIMPDRHKKFKIVSYEDFSKKEV